MVLNYTGFQHADRLCRAEPENVVDAFGRRPIPYGCTTLRIAEFPTRIVPWDLEYRLQEP